MFIEYIDKLRSQGRRFFLFEEVLRDLNTSINSVKAGLYRLKKEGKLITPAKGLYVIVPPEYQPYGSIPAEELVPPLMKYLKAEYYVALLSAANFYGASHQKPKCFQIITNKRIRHKLEFGQVKLETIYKKHIVGLPMQEVTVATGYLKVASPELIIFDLLNYPLRSGGLNHIATVLSELIPAVNSEKLLQLADQIGEKAWLQRLGFILEKIDFIDQENSSQLICKLQAYLSNKSLVFVPLTPELTKPGYPRIEKWKVIENTTIESDL